MRHFLRQVHHSVDPDFLRAEHAYVQRGLDTLHVMEQHHDQLVRDLERARELAHAAHIPVERDLRGEGGRLLALIGIGNRYRRDDGAGLEVARRLRVAHPPGVTVLEQEGEPASMIEAWSHADEALVVDCVSSGSEPGKLHRFEVDRGPLPAEVFRGSTHALGLPDAVELARELGRLPRSLVVYGIEGQSFEAGEGLTPPVQEAVGRLVMELYRDLEGRA